MKHKRERLNIYKQHARSLMYLYILYDRTTSWASWVTFRGMRGTTRPYNNRYRSKDSSLMSLRSRSLFSVPKLKDSLNKAGQVGSSRRSSYNSKRTTPDSNLKSSPRTMRLTCSRQKSPIYSPSTFLFIFK